jgi:hypothetical protein
MALRSSPTVTSDLMIASVGALLVGLSRSSTKLRRSGPHARVIKRLMFMPRQAGMRAHDCDNDSDEHRRVGILRRRRRSVGRCGVTSDNEAGGYMAARHLIESGRRRLVFAGGPTALTPVRDRRAGVKRAVAESNGAVQLSFLRSDELQAVDGRKVGAQIVGLPANERPDGIVAAADLLALGIREFSANKLPTP